MNRKGWEILGHPLAQISSQKIYFETPLLSSSAAPSTIPPPLPPLSTATPTSALLADLLDYNSIMRPSGSVPNLEARPFSIFSIAMIFLPLVSPE
ncbi:unnamed protein product [Coffea canephora]|uniref:Uncharacterized protein n=1 Tax=Coffea canephora TaxID=49390 RepID=A0A068UBL3_COFCA|nr:unnamed protein product [Coffea canephora]